ncbi:hypothetical protein O181_082596 [Austropuccinia psidii MF-1]|uniref:Uncharacterized protein n=1 Tax=Austropuccinia psidii MF-1 TaxID=1389203 RepID=A0A9Q3FME2_9BASI|nr:hypothetical protein [Austropuccinia psidii MF-1]
MQASLLFLVQVVSVLFGPALTAPFSPTHVSAPLRRSFDDDFFSNEYGSGDTRNHESGDLEWDRGMAEKYFKALDGSAAGFDSNGNGYAYRKKGMQAAQSTAWDKGRASYESSTTANPNDGSQWGKNYPSRYSNANGEGEGGSNYPSRYSDPNGEGEGGSNYPSRYSDANGEGEGGSSYPSRYSDANGEGEGGSNYPSRYSAPNGEGTGKNKDSSSDTTSPYEDQPRHSSAGESKPTYANSLAQKPDHTSNDLHEETTTAPNTTELSTTTDDQKTE